MLAYSHRTALRIGNPIKSAKMFVVNDGEKKRKKATCIKSHSNSIIETVLINIFRNYLDLGLRGAFSMFPDDTKL